MMEQIQQIIDETPVVLLIIGVVIFFSLVSFAFRFFINRSIKKAEDGEGFFDSIGGAGLLKRPGTLVKDGKPALGTILDRTPTGQEINNIRVYDISIEMNDGVNTWNATMSSALMPEELGVFEPGSRLPMAYKENKPEKADFAPQFQEEVSEILHNDRVRKGLADPDAAEIDARGVDAHGVVKSIEPTGEILHGETQFELTVLVTERSGEKTPMSKKIFMSYENSQLLGPGKVVQVRYIPGTQKFYTMVAAA